MRSAIRAIFYKLFELHTLPKNNFVEDSSLIDKNLSGEENERENEAMNS